MHFCLTGQYSPQALNSIMDNPTTSRYEAAKSMIESAGGKLISMYSTAANGPGVLVIFDVPDPNAAPAISGIVTASGALQNVELKRLWTQEEIASVRQTASKLLAPTSHRASEAARTRLLARNPRTKKGEGSRRPPSPGYQRIAKFRCCLPEWLVDESCRGYRVV
jgi:uncharacterized protein with GYD domain